MNRKLMEEELAKLGITNAQELNEAIKKMEPLDISIMVSKQEEDTKASCLVPSHISAYIFSFGGS